MDKDLLTQSELKLPHRQIVTVVLGGGSREADPSCFQAAGLLIFIATGGAALLVHKAASELEKVRIRQSEMPSAHYS